MNRGAWWDIVHKFTESDTAEELSMHTLYPHLRNQAFAQRRNYKQGEKTAFRMGENNSQ